MADETIFQHELNGHGNDNGNDAYSVTDELNGDTSLIADGQQTPVSSLSPVPHVMQDLNGSAISNPPPATHIDAEKGQTPPVQDFDGALHQSNDIKDKAPSPLPQAPKFRKKTKRMNYQGVDLTAEAGETSGTISWHAPHPIFVIILVGSEEAPFGIQKDLLCAQSPYYREEFEKTDQQIEYIVKLPDTDIDTFGCFQNFIYTGAVYDRARVSIPDYPLLIDVWKLATKLKMAPLRVSVLDVMNERRQQTLTIPGTPLLVQAWKETEEGSGLRTMLITWAAEHMRSSPEIRNSFAKSLPQEILSELVIVMSDLPTPYAPALVDYAPQTNQGISNPLEINVGPGSPLPVNLPARPSNPNKRPRKSDVGFNIADEAYEVKPSVKKVARRSEVGNVNRRKSKGGPSAENAIPMTADREMNFCRDLIFRMLSGPGYWTRLVGPFRNPVDPVADNVPNYFAVVKRPMDLITIRDKMARGDYNTVDEFEADVRLIFQNCYEYWTEKDQIFNTCMAFEKYFNEKWNSRHKWIAPTIKSEIVD